MTIAGQGFVELDEERAAHYDIPKRITYNDGERDRYFLGTAIVHSVHCLYAIMAEYDALALGIKKFPLDTEHMVKIA
jgi:hypothetical protein